MSYLIGVAGQAQNGKDTLADYLQVTLNELRCENYWQRGAFAKAVKQIFMDTFGKDMDYIEKWKVVPEAPPDLDMPVRQALQFIGDGFRKIKASIWIDLLIRDKTPRIVSDARYVNELKAVYESGGFNILVVRPDRINDDPNGSEAQMRPFADYVMAYYNSVGKIIGRVIDPELIQILGETPPEGWQYLHCVVVNDGTIKSLHNDIDQFVSPRIIKFLKD